MNRLTLPIVMSGLLIFGWANPGAAAKSSEPHTVPAELRVHALVCDPIITESLVDSLMRLISTRDSFTHMSGQSTSIGNSGSDVMPNPFSFAGSSGGSAGALHVDVDIEEVSYGKISESDKAVGFLAFGILGAIIAKGESFGAIVQLRGILSGTEVKREQTVLIRTGTPVNLKETGRRAAVISATKRALWDLTYQLAQEADSELGLNLKHQRGAESFSEYLKAVDSW